MNVQPAKFQVGDRVKFMNDNDGEAGVVVGFSYNMGEGWAYTISARELDIPNKQVVDGVKHCKEDELVAVEENPVQETEQEPVIESQEQVTDQG